MHRRDALFRRIYEHACLQLGVTPRPTKETSNKVGQSGGYSSPMNIDKCRSCEHALVLLTRVVILEQQAATGVVKQDSPTAPDAVQDDATVSTVASEDNC